MDQPRIPADALCAPRPRETLWKFSTEHGTALVNHEYFLTTPSRWFADERSQDPSWKADPYSRGRLFVHRITLSI
jgi:hypothetical protein